MRYRAIIFDLFGTLVSSFTRHEYDQVNSQMAAAVRVPYTEFWQLMGETYRDFCLGRYNAYEDLISDACSRAGVQANKAQITQAAAFHYEFIAGAIVPEPEVLETLDRLKKRGLRLGLISDCGPSVPALFPQSPLARFIAIFAQWGASQIILAIFYWLAILRYRFLTPFMLSVVVLEQLLRMGAGLLKPGVVASAPPGATGNYILLPLGLIALFLSLRGNSKAT